MNRSFFSDSIDSFCRLTTEEIIGKIIKSPVDQYEPIQYDNLQ